LTTALRGAAAGVGSLENVGVVLITGFSGSGVVVGLFVLGFGFGLVVLAGFHIQVIPFAFGCCSAQALLRLLVIQVRTLGDNQRGHGTFITNSWLSATIPKLLDWRCFSAVRPRPCAPDTPQ
jgi:hypothetical protein